jgi:hypothetical protein
MLKLAVIQINDMYSAPEGTWYLGAGGWQRDVPELLSLRTGGTLGQLLQQLAEDSGNSLGPGELVLAVYEPEGQDVSSDGVSGVREYKGMVMFSADSEQTSHKPASPEEK